MNKNVVHELLGVPRLKIVQNPNYFSFSIDSMLLADFINPESATKIIDLGTGNAPIPLYLSLKTKAKIYGIELQQEIYELATESIKINELTQQISLYNANIKGISKVLDEASFDIVCSNPPYFKYHEGANINKNSFLSIARHEIEITFDALVKEAYKLLKDGKSFYLIHRCERLSEVMMQLEANHFGIKEIRLVYSKQNDNAILFLLKAKKNRPSAIVMLPPLYLYDQNMEYTEEVKNIFNFKNR